MRHKRDLAPECLFHLGHVPVPKHAIRGHRAVILGEVCAVTGCPSRSRDAGFGIHDHVAREINQPRLHQGRQRQQGRSRITAGARHKRGLLDGRTVVFNKAVCRVFGQQRGGRIPLRTHRIVGNPERAGNIDHLDAGFKQFRRQAGRRCFRDRKEDKRGLGQLRPIEGFNRAAPRAGKTRHRPGRRIRARRHGGRNLDLRMPVEEGQQLLARIPCGSRDCDTYWR